MRTPAAVLSVLALLIAAAPASAALPQQSGDVDLRTQAQGRVGGTTGQAQLLGGVAGIGDVNGDGVGDFALAVAEGSQAGVWVLYGRSPLELVIGSAGPGASGFRIAVPAPAPIHVAGAGDVSLDGLGDLVIGAPAAGGGAGKAWVVFGRATTTTVDVVNPGFGGFQIDGGTGSALGASVAGAGDANGDGRPDVVVGAPNANSGSGQAYVIFGRTDPAIVTTSFGSPPAGYTLSGPTGSRAGEYVGGVGDVNGDGRGDTGVGAPAGTAPSGSGSGLVWVVFGTPVSSPTNISLDTIETDSTVRGFEIEGPAASAALGPVAPAGDVNGDGRADVVAGAPGDSRSAPGTEAGSVSVVFGKPGNETVTTSALGERGYQFVLSNAAERLGADVRGGADLNGDGVPDVVAGAPAADPGNLEDAGRAYALYGRPGGGAPLDVAGLTPAAGYRVNGPRGRAASSPASVLGTPGSLGLGDANADGRADLLGVAKTGSAGGTNEPGTLFAVLGFGIPAFSYPAQINVATGLPMAGVGPAITRRTGPPTFTITPALPAGLALDPASGVISGITDVPGTSTHTVTLTDLAASNNRTIRIVVAGGIDRVVPVITRARLSAKKFRIGARSTPLSLNSSAKKKRKKKAPFGTTLRMVLSERATLKVAVACARPIAKRNKKACTKLAKKNNTITRKIDAPGDSVVNFTGRMGKKALPKAKFTMTITATDASRNASKPVRLKFQVVAK